MEDDALEMVAKIQSALTERSRVGEAVFEYFALNEFDTIYMFQSALSSRSECLILDEMQRRFKLKKYEVDWLYLRMYETVFGFKPNLKDSDDEEEEDSDYEEEEEEESKGNVKGFNLKPNQLDWNMTQNDLTQFRDHLKKHNDRLSLGTHYGEAGRSLLRILAVGHRYGIDLLQLVLDIFCEFRIDRYFATNKATHLNMKSFMKSSPYFRRIKENERKLWSNATEYYHRKFGHVLLFKAMNQINDNYLKFMQYIFATTQCLDKLRASFMNGSGCPFQVDLWIIPRHAVRVENAHSPFDDDDDDDDDLFDYIEDEDDDDDEMIDELNCPETEEEDTEIGNIEMRLDSEKIEYIKEVIGHNQHKNAISAKMLNAIKSVTKNEFHHKRVVVIIDRRDSSRRKWSTSSDVMYVYRPNFCGSIHKDRFGFETLNNLSRTYILPKLKTEQRVSNISTTDDLKGRMCLLSFHIYDWRRIQCYWYFQSGSCTRFRPRHLYILWPLYFVNSINRDGFQQINKKVVEKEWKIPLKDDLFDSWYPLLTGFKIVPKWN